MTENNDKVDQLVLEVPCDKCGGSGCRREGECSKCNGTGLAPTEAGERIIGLIQRHIKLRGAIM